MKFMGLFLRAHRNTAVARKAYRLYFECKEGVDKSKGWALHIYCNYDSANLRQKIKCRVRVGLCPLLFQWFEENLLTILAIATFV